MEVDYRLYGGACGHAVADANVSHFPLGIILPGVRGASPAGCVYNPDPHTLRVLDMAAWVCISMRHSALQH